MWFLEKLEDVYQWTIANWWMILMSVIAFLILDDFRIVLKTIFIIILLEFIALQLFEKILRFVRANKFLNRQFTGADDLMSVMERHGYAQFIASALISAHLIVGISAFGIYFTYM